MLTAEHYPKPFAEVSLQKRDLLEIHRSKISLDRQKRLQPSNDTPSLHVLRACRAVNAYLSEGAWWGACVSCRCL